MLLSLCKHPPLKDSRWSIRSKTVTVWITWNERFDYIHDYLISPTCRVSLWEKKSGSIIGRIQFVSFSKLSNIEILTNLFEFLLRSLFRRFSIGSTPFVLRSMTLASLTIANVSPCRKPAPLMPHNSGGSETSQNRCNSFSCRSSQLKSDVIFCHDIIVSINIQT